MKRLKCFKFEKIAQFSGRFKSRQARLCAACIRMNAFDNDRVTYHGVPSEEDCCCVSTPPSRFAANLPAAAAAFAAALA
jgi:hypothetical protein